MKILAKVLPGILGIAFLGVGLLFMFNPAATLDRLELVPNAIAGWASIRSFIGGTFLGLAVLLFHGVIKSEGKPIRMVGILLAAAVLGRIVSLVADGVDGTVIGPVVIEIILVAICFFAANTLEAEATTS